jgi:hypothetical protein
VEALLPARQRDARGERPLGLARDPLEQARVCGGQRDDAACARRVEERQQPAAALEPAEPALGLEGEQRWLIEAVDMGGEITLSTRAA